MGRIGGPGRRCICRKLFDGFTSVEVLKSFAVEWWQLGDRVK